MLDHNISPQMLPAAALGEIPFGPEYYSLAVDGISFGERIFGYSCLWSPDSRFFAIQEWMTNDPKRGPQTRLLLIDVREKAEAAVCSAETGFVEPRTFSGEKIVCLAAYYRPTGSGQLVRSEEWQEITLPSAEHWRSAFSRSNWE